MKKLSHLVCMLICFTMLCCSCSPDKSNSTPPDIPPNSGEEQPTAPDEPTDFPDIPSEGPVCAESYDEIISVLTGEADIIYTAPVSGAPEPESGVTVLYALPPDLSSENTRRPENTAYADGHIFLLRGGSLLICDESGVISETELFTQSYSYGGDNDDPNHFSYGSENPQGIYVCGDTAAVLTSSYAYSEDFDTEAGEWQYGEKNLTSLIILDISDPAAPVITKILSQDGAYCSAYAEDDRVFIVTSMFINSIAPAAPEAFVPCLYSGEDKAPLAPSDILILPENTCSGYTVISGYDLASSKSTGARAVLGGLGSLYMDEGAAFMIFSSTSIRENGTHTEGSYTITDYKESTSSYVLRFALTSSLDSAGLYTSGAPKNNCGFGFSGGSFYMCADITASGYGIYRDSENGWENRKDYDAVTESAVYMIPADMHAAALMPLPKEWEVQSVIFLSGMAYVTTSAGTQSVDAEAGAVCQSAVFLPEKLCRYDGSLYLGISPSDSGSYILSMTNLDDMTVVSSAELSSPESTDFIPTDAVAVLSEHSAAAVLIGSCYNIYGYSGSGFSLIAQVPVTGRQSDCRFIEAGGCAFVISDTVTVLSLPDMTAVQSYEAVSPDITGELG